MNYFEGRLDIVPFAIVQHVEWDLTEYSKESGQIFIITSHTKWNFEYDCWENALCMAGDDAKRFIKEWKDYIDNRWSNPETKVIE